MYHFICWLKKSLRFICMTLLSTYFFINHANAQVTNQAPPSGANSCSDTLTCLSAITTNTYGALEDLNNLPSYLNGLIQMATSWLTDTSKDGFTSQIQAGFATLGAASANDMNSQNALATQQQLIADMLGLSAADFNSPNPKVLNTVPNINDLSYATLIGAPPVPKAPISPYNYLKNASGFSISHPAPNLNWQGTAQDQTNYSNYFNTISAIESFDAYTLSNQYADTLNGAAFNNTQSSLIAEASGSAWLLQITTEELGKVLRHILLFDSQSYVLLSQLVQLQRQQLAAQAMTNTLLITNNGMNESLLLSKAQGVRLGG